MIYTGYYAKHGKLHNAVSISVYKPKWLPNMLHLPLFAPSWDLVKRIKKGEINEEQYVEEFLEILENRNIDYKQIIAEFDEKILCCFETPDDFCHRHIVGLLLKEHGAKVEEKK